VRDGDAAHAGSRTAAHEEVAIRDLGRLHNARIRRPRVLPKQRATGWGGAGRAGSAQKQDLRDSADGRQVRRAVAGAALRARPARFAGGEVVGGELALGGDNDLVVHYQWRAREAPARAVG